MSRMTWLYRKIARNTLYKEKNSLWRVEKGEKDYQSHADMLKAV